MIEFAFAAGDTPFDAPPEFPADGPKRVRNSGYADAFRSGHPESRDYLLAGLLSSSLGQVAIVRGRNERWWLLKPGDSLPDTLWQFIGTAAGRGLFLCHCRAKGSSKDGRKYLSLRVGSRLTDVESARP